MTNTEGEIGFYALSIASVVSYNLNKVLFNK